MTDFRAFLADLRRPRLLVRAARHGLAHYRRQRDLRRVIGADAAGPVEAVLTRLIETEAQIEAMRQGGDAGYSVARHIETLIAMMAETALTAR